MRELLNDHTLVLDIAETSIFALLALLENQEEDDTAASLRSMYLHIGSLREQFATTWAQLGIIPREER